ncbi:MAG TPA: exopolysaccharide biosynthesis GT4 family glycosyltransferase EpsE [Steroidobacteraceae bacterium]|nr:exopolysaccharide biosynthesis GT4 family glycosyltransferase EpsE [Steroidobacteraceae bacterium]
MVRIGYLVPEFPGQTHIFFWRELRSLREMGVECDLISTKRPPMRIISHSWSREAMARTTYLSPPTFGAIRAAVGALARSGPLGWWRVARAIAGAEVTGPARRIRLCGLALGGAHLAALARRREWRHLHVHSCADSAHLAMFAHLIGGIPYSVMLHGPMEDYGPNQTMKWRHAAFGIVITRKLLQEVRTALGKLERLDVEVAPMGVNIREFVRSTPYIPWSGSGPFRIYACGRLNPCKGHDDLIRAVGLLHAAGIDARLQIAGADDSRGLYQRSLEALIAELQLQDAVTLLGAVAEDRVRRGLEESHVFALASLHEPLGVAIMEAMAMELPVVVTRAGGVPELVSDGVDGVLVDPRSPEDLARGLTRIARDPELAKRIAAPARMKIESAFQSDQSARVLVRRVTSVDLASRGTASAA